ncbi:beta-lactamase-like protein [Crucibulum laeve]|uniref:Beta-lactamase-like protein n=1 Tax=Crucibulum laeve TaxID=68775 RepID=A0A5C3LXF4_9AGAR|nr:beta-lactamase-like protein [Crucibulum laeve]
MELIFLGTGTSSSLPHLDCLTSPPDRPPCKTCLSTLTPEGKKNIRRNTSAVIRAANKDQKPVTIVIDAGKNFQAAAIEWFPKYGLRKIDALLITHAHADAMNGLDDLRGWTLRGAIQSHIDVYVSQETFTEVQRSFPYLVAKEFASGGGDVPEFKWHIFNDRVPFEIQDTGIEIVPFAVHHGRVFSVAPPPAYISTPNATLPSTPDKKTMSLPCRNTTSATNGVKNRDDEEKVIYPYLSYGFKVQERLAYISDVSFIPDDIWPILRCGNSNGSLPILALDCLRLLPHTSHVGLAGALAIAQRINASRTYLTGFGHEVSHEEYVTIGEVVGGAEIPLERLTEVEKQGLELVGEEKGFWVRPAHDGLRVLVASDGRVKDETYDG